MRTRIEFNDAALRSKITRLKALGQNLAPVMEDIATLGENTTRERFSKQIGPDGKRWKPSLRVLASGGKTLTKDGHLGDSVGHRSTSKFAEWGVNRIYARIHQLGGKAGRGLKSVIVARPYLGFNADNEADALDLLVARINRAS